MRFSSEYFRALPRGAAAARTVCGCSGVSAVHLFWLYLLREYPEGLAASRLAELSNIDRSLVSRQLKPLLGRGLVCADGKTGKRRYGWKIRLTDSGRALAEQIAREALSIQNRAGRGILPEELVAFTACSARSIRISAAFPLQEEPMKNVQIILDSACDMQKPEADALGVTLLPLRTKFGGEVFLDGVTMTHDEFFSKSSRRQRHFRRPARFRPLISKRHSGGSMRRERKFLSSHSLQSSPARTRAL